MSVFDYLSKKYADDFNKKHPLLATKPVKNQDTIDTIDGDYQKQSQQIDDAYQQKKSVNDKGMTDNAPETPEEKAAREKRERNQRLISGIGNAINGVSGMISGFSGGYAFPEEAKKEDPVETNINSSKAERLARAQRYYNFAQANNKALEDYLKAKRDLAKQKDEADINKYKAEYYRNSARGKGVHADNLEDVMQSQVDRNQKQGDAAMKRAENTGTSGTRSGGGSAGGRKADDPAQFPYITSGNGRKVTFRTTNHQTKAYEAALQFVPKEEPYYEQNVRTGQWKLKGAVSTIVSRYAQSQDSDANQNFWDALESYAYDTSKPAVTEPEQKTEAPWKKKKKKDTQSGSGTETGSGGPITL